MTVPVTAAGFENPVENAQATFRAAMRALAEPGTIQCVAPAPAAAGPVSGATAALLLALCDYETPIWLDADAVARPGLADFLRFQTGAPVVADPARAAFAVVTDPAGLPPLEVFAQGSLDYPDRSTTLLVQVEGFDPEGSLSLTGPGIPGERRLGIAPEIPGFAGALADNRDRFPRGVDVILVAGDRIVGLPRSTRVVEEAR